MLRKNIPAFSIGEEPLGKIRGHDIELYLDVQLSYPPMLRRPPYQASLETRDLIMKIGNNEIVEISTLLLINWNDGQSRFCGDPRVLNNYIKADRYPIPRIPNALDKLANSKYITKMDCMKGLNKWG
ncbi:hypothetical protein O181_007547 [Austropuccinia psidii MF-1]|uniref:Uncharacterized protein n=1 Tax=Austropuccinia psidii MF-1 TaxID=1389203 RepID=A0A9Q3GIK9_9BASI|nr:hypothetical protein [Austropuccinia psidii MF-1]